MSSSKCTQLAKFLRNLREIREEFVRLKDSYRRRGKELVYQQAVERYSAFENIVSDLFVQYKGAVKELMEEWLDLALKDEDFRSTARIEVDEEDWLVVVDIPTDYTTVEVYPLSSSKKEFCFPSLLKTIKVGEMLMEEGRDIIVPAGLNIPLEGEKFFAPNLKRIEGWLYVDNINNVVFPSLEYVSEGISSSNAKTFRAPSLEEVGGNLNLPNVTSLDLPSLRIVEGNIYAPKASTVSVPNLRTARALNLSSVKKLNATSLILVERYVCLGPVRSISEAFGLESGKTLEIGKLVISGRNSEDKERLRKEALALKEQGSLKVSFIEYDT